MVANKLVLQHGDALAHTRMAHTQRHLAHTPVQAGVFTPQWHSTRTANIARGAQTGAIDAETVAIATFRAGTSARGHSPRDLRPRGHSARGHSQRRVLALETIEPHIADASAVHT